MERIFQILAVALGGVTAFFLWRGEIEAVFVAGVLGACSFLLSIRMQAKTRLAKQAADAQTDDEN